LDEKHNDQADRRGFIASVSGGLLSQSRWQLRKTVHAKYGGRCAYCGEEITLEQMQVDHLRPKQRGVQAYLKAAGIPIDKSLDDMSNLMPSCASCNNRKRTHPLEEFRAEIAEQVRRLRRDSNQFRLALRFGLVEVKDTPVIFWFER